MLHPDTRVAHIDDVQGNGVVAVRHIPRGALIWVGDGQDAVLSQASLARMSAAERQLWSDFAWVGSDGTIRLCGDLARYVNHACEPNCVGVGANASITVRPIAPGEQVTEDYLPLNRVYRFRCRCGARTCRGRVAASARAYAKLAAAWNQALRSALKQLLRVPQPLWRVLAADEARLLQLMAAGMAPVPPPDTEVIDPVDLEAVLGPLPGAQVSS